MYGIRWEPRYIVAWLNGIAFVTGFPGTEFASDIARHFGADEPTSQIWWDELTARLFPAGPPDYADLDEAQGREFLSKLFELLIGFAEADPTEYAVEPGFVELK